MKFVDVIPEADQNLITRYIEMWGSSYNNICKLKAPLPHIMRHWEYSKQTLYKLLCNNIVLSKETLWGASTAKKREAMIDVYNKNALFISSWKATLSCLDLPLSITYWEVYNIMDSIPRLIDNRIAFDYEIPLPDGKIYKIQKGAKISKMVQKISKAYNIEGYEKFLLDHSMALNIPDKKGTLCLSIHPLDFLTMSEVSSWHSCMCWSRDGDYRQGTVEMMNSPMVVCAYVYWDNFSILDMPGDPTSYWNNKRWRKLFIVQPDCILGVRGYPYERDEVDEEVMLWLSSLARENLGWDFNEKILYGEGDDGEYLFFKNHDGDEIEWEIDTGWMYNDFYYKHPLMLPVGEKGQGLYFNYSGESECMTCGDHIDIYETDEADHVLCSNCDAYERCVRCDEKNSPNNMYLVDGDWVCQDCYEIYAKAEYYTENITMDYQVQTISFYSKNDKGEILYHPIEKECRLYVYTENMARLKRDYPSLVELEVKHGPWGYTTYYLAIDLDEIDEDTFIRFTGLTGKEDLKVYGTNAATIYNAELKNLL